MRSHTVALAAITIAASAISQPAPPSFPREFRGVWVASVANIDWPTSRTLTTAQQQAEIRAILDRASSLKLNAVLVQIRPACDSLYASTLEPWSPYLTNLMGQAPNPAYDPLAYWISEGHARNIEVHAWLNPYRALASTSIIPSSNHVSVTRPDLVRTYGTAKWLDPGEPEVPIMVRNVTLDIVNRYDIDGLVFDDYFYPYPISGTPFPDDTSYQAYLNGGGTLSKDNWRRDNVNRFVQTTYIAVKLAKPWVRFGISPFGIWRPGNPPGITGLDAYASIYADSKKWLNLGWCDYFAPQLYWRISPPAQSFPSLLTWWAGQNTLNRHLAPAMATYNLSSAYGNWPLSEIENQLAITRSTPGVNGAIHYNESSFRLNYKGVLPALAADEYSQSALMPSMTWIDATAPPPPTLESSLKSPYAAEAFAVRFNWAPNSSETVYRWIVFKKYGLTWSSEVVSGATISITAEGFRNGEQLMGFAVSALDRFGNESTRTIWPN